MSDHVVSHLVTVAKVLGGLGDRGESSLGLEGIIALAVVAAATLAALILARTANARPSGSR